MNELGARIGALRLAVTVGLRVHGHRSDVAEQRLLTGANGPTGDVDLDTAPVREAAVAAEALVPIVEPTLDRRREVRAHGIRNGRRCAPAYAHVHFTPVDHQVIQVPRATASDVVPELRVPALVDPLRH